MVVFERIVLERVVLERIVLEMIGMVVFVERIILERILLLDCSLSRVFFLSLTFDIFFPLSPPSFPTF